MLQKESSVGYLKSTKINSQAKEKSLQLKDRTKRQYNPDDTNIAKLFLAIREHRTGNPQLNKISEIEELLTQVQNINDLDFNDDGNTPLHVAVSKNHQDIVELLLNTPGVNPEATNNRDKTPFDIAKSLGNKDIIQQLYRASPLKRENTGENKPEVGSPKKPRISSIKKEEPEGAKIEEGEPRTYPASGLKNNLHGNIYQLKLLMLFLKCGLDQGYSFRLATEWNSAEKFDDLVFIHDDSKSKKTYRFLQAKHKQNKEDNKIGISDLLTKNKEGEFNLAKYFISYLKIKYNQDFTNCELKDFIICTNIDFDLDQSGTQDAVKKLKVQKNKKKEIWVEMIEDNDVFFKDGGERYKLSCDKGNMALVVQQEFKVAVEETITKLETEIKKLQDKSDQDSKNKLKQIQKWEKEFKQIANSGLEDNIKEFFGKLVFAVNQPNEDKLATILQGKIGKEFEAKFNYAGNLSEDAYNKFQRVVQDWMKEKQGRFLSHKEVKEFFNNFESRVSTVVEIKQELKYLKDIVLEHIVTPENNKQAQKDVWFDAENPSELFVGRTEELEKLHRALHDQGRIGVISQVSRISGLGGIGKTELAKKYICEYAKKHYNNVIWINAENDKTIADSFYRLASDKLGITIKNADREKKHVKSIIEEVFKSFSTEKSLFVFDNAEGLEYLKQILPLNNLMPNVKIPYILITSRSKEWGKKIRTIDLDTLSLDDSIKFIKKGLEIEDKSQNDQIGNLVKELQYFPLAIQQAIAYIKETQESYNFEGYLEKYREKTKELINYKVFEWVNNGYTKTTYTVWEVTLDRIIEDKECGQLALDILNTMAYFAPENIIREMFLSLAGGSQTKLESAINLLVNYSMVNGEQKQSLSIHRLVQGVTRLKLQEQQKEEEVLKKALELIKSSTIKKENISHVTSVLDYASRYNKLINNFDFTYGGRKYTPLNLLIEGNREEGVKNILDNLRRERYPSKLLKVVNTLDEYGYSPLRLAIENSHLQIVKYLIENGADLDNKYEKGFTPLHFAALFGNLELARYLVNEEHVSFNVLDKYGKSPLHIASENGRIELAKYLVGEKKANINVLDNQHMAPLHFVAENGNLELAKYLIENGADFYLRDRFNFTPIERAIDRRQDDIVKYLIEVKDGFGFTYLHKAAFDGNLDLFKHLINHKADLYIVDDNGSSPLHLAAENGKLEIVRYIMDKKLYNIDIVNNDKRTPLLLAAQNGHLEIVKFLVDKGANFFLRDRFNFTPIERAIDRRQDDIVKYLIEVKDGFGFTYLHKAAFDGNLDLFKHLINHKADLYIVDDNGSSPLHLAAENGKLEIVRYIMDKKLYNIDIVNNDKRTPLLLAAQNGHLEMVKFLVDKGANFFLRDRFNFTPIERAIDRRQDDIVKYLTEVKNRSVADECLPSPSYRQKREAESKCLFTWEDVDEFNEEKDERRNLGKIKIDGEKFIDYIKDLPEGKQDQLIQLADKVRIVGNSQGLVSKLTSNQKVMNHLSKVGKISVMTMHGMMAKNVLADFLNGDYKGVAINIGFIAGGQGFAKVAEIASLKGLKLASEGKLLLGRSLKAASPFLARGTSAFVVYDLVNQIKAFKNGTEEALVGVVGDSIYLGVDAAEIGIEVAEAFEVLEGVSSVTGPIGATIGAVVFIGTDIYMAVKRVDKIDEIVHLTGGERIIEGLRAFVGIKPEQYIEELIEKKQLNDQLVKQGLEYLKEHNNIQRYVFPTKRSVVDSCYKETKTKYILQAIPFDVVREKCKVKIQDDLDNVAFFDKEVSNVIYDRAKPDAPDGGELFCLPAGPIRPENGGENAYLCHDAIGLDYQANRTGDYTLIALGKGKDRATGFKYSPNVFLVDDGDKDFTGGDKDDLFILVGNRVTGRLDGGGGNNTLNLAEFSLNENLNIKPDSRKNDSSISSSSNDIRIKNMNIIYGRKGKQDIVDCGCDVRYIDGQGGLSNNTPDNITIPYCYRPSEKKVIARPSTEINNLDQSSNGNFDYIILPDKGKANINIEPDFSLTRQRKHNFLFNYTLFDLASVDIKNIKDINHWHAGYRNMTHTIRNVTFSFLSTLSKGKSINEKFDITISDIPANASYILSDNTEIKIGKNNLYAMHSTDKTIDEIVENYPTIADHLRMSLFISTNNETVVMGHGNHDIINNNFLQKSHLIGSGGENIYVITSGHEILDIENLPIPEVIIYDDLNSLKDTLDLRQLVRQVNGDLSIEPISKIIEDRNDLLIKLSISAIALKQDVITVRLKDAFVNNWYKELQVILNNAPMKISSELELKLLPLIFDKDKEIIIVTPQDVEEKSELIISKEAGQYTFLSSGYDLMITNVFSADMETNKFCTICLKDFYKQPKMETLSVRFNDTEILLSNEIDKINNADSISDKLNMNGYVSSIVKLQESSAPLEAASSNHPIRHKRHKDHSGYGDGVHRARHKHHRVQKRNINYQNSHYYIDQSEIATNSAARTSLWINIVANTIVDAIKGISQFVYSPLKVELPEIPENGSDHSDIARNPSNQYTNQFSSEVCVSNNVGLAFFLLQSFLDKKYPLPKLCSITPEEALANTLNIIGEFEEILRKTAKQSGVLVKDVNFFKVYLDIAGHVRNERYCQIPNTLYSVAKEVCPKNEKFLSNLKGNIEKMCDEQQVVNSGYQPNDIADNKPRNYLNNTTVDKQLQGSYHAISS